MSVVRREDRPVLERGPDLPTLQRLVDRANGSSAVTVLINQCTHGETVPRHAHDVEEVLLVIAGQCAVTVDGSRHTARAGVAVIVQPGTDHSITHHADEPCTVVAVLGSPDVRIG